MFCLKNKETEMKRGRGRKHFLKYIYKYLYIFFKYHQLSLVSNKILLSSETGSWAFHNWPEYNELCIYHISFRFSSRTGRLIWLESHRVRDIHFPIVIVSYSLKFCSSKERSQLIDRQIFDSLKEEDKKKLWPMGESVAVKWKWI